MSPNLTSGSVKELINIFLWKKKIQEKTELDYENEFAEGIRHLELIPLIKDYERAMSEAVEMVNEGPERIRPQTSDDVKESYNQSYQFRRRRGALMKEELKTRGVVFNLHGEIELEKSSEEVKSAVAKYHEKR